MKKLLKSLVCSATLCELQWVDCDCVCRPLNVNKMSMNIHVERKKRIKSIWERNFNTDLWVEKAKHKSSAAAIKMQMCVVQGCGNRMEAEVLILVTADCTNLEAVLFLSIPLRKKSLNYSEITAQLRRKDLFHPQKVAKRCLLQTLKWEFYDKEENQTRRW